MGRAKAPAMRDPLLIVHLEGMVTVAVIPANVSLLVVGAKSK
jgi:hypothetical protein